jgi:hypothetical protein
VPLQPENLARLHKLAQLPSRTFGGQTAGEQM